MHRAARLTRHTLAALIVGGTAALTTVASLSAAAAVAGAGAPPAAPSQRVTDTLHGVSVPDPYRNLENLKRPDTQRWLKAQGEYGADLLARIDGREAMTQRIQALASESGDVVWGLMRMPGERSYFMRRKVGENQMKLVLRAGPNGPDRVLVDPEPMSQATGVPHAINFFMPSWDGKTLAYGVSSGGSENASLYLMDIASGKPLGTPIPRVQERNIHWSPDSRSLTYNQLRELPAGTPETETFLDTTVFVLTLDRARRPGAVARPLFGPLVNRALKLDRLDVAEVMFAPDSRYMIARTTDTTVPEGRLYVAPVAELARKNIAWRQIASAADKITQVRLRGDTLYLRTYAGAPRGRVLALTLANPVLANAVEVVPEPDAGVMKGFVLGRDALYTEVQLGFNVRARRHTGSTPGQGTDAAPAIAGSTYVAADPASAYRDVWVTTSNWTEPARLMALATDGSSRDTGLLTTIRPAGTPELEASEVLVPSHDGALVPLAILRRKGLVLDGSNPTLLVGYGAYGFTFQAFFDPRNIAWLERGGVLAFANVRGSGAFGDPWYRAGFKATKPNTWKDGLACAHYLIDQRFTSPATLGIWGTSAGGIFVGRAVTTEPALFAAAIFDVGVMDAVRAETSANGITNTSEFGSVANAAEFPALLEMSTYHQIRDATPYPAVMFIHGLNDPRVDVWQSAKAAARLQATSTSGKPILLRLDGQAGHGVGSTAQQGYSKQADIYSFLLWQFGKATSKP
jgi:prolyl oligopeptidase